MYCLFSNSHQFETTFAELCDFSMYGYFENTGDPVDVRVRLYYLDGDVIRTLESKC